jgi:hypothetical protein
MVLGTGAEYNITFQPKKKAPPIHDFACAGPNYAAVSFGTSLQSEKSGQSEKSLIIFSGTTTYSVIFT